MHIHGGWIAASLLTEKAGDGDARASGSRGVQQRPTARGPYARRRRGGSRSQGAAGVLKPRMLAGWCLLGELGVVGRSADGCRRSRGPSTLTRCPRRGRSGIAREW